MTNVRNDSVKVAEAHRQAEIIHKALLESDLKTRQTIADALLDIWQFDMHPSGMRDVAVKPLTTVADLQREGI